LQTADPAGSETGEETGNGRVDALLAARTFFSRNPDAGHAGPLT